MLPETGKFLEFVRGDLVVGRVARLAAAVVDWFTFDLASARAKDAFRIFLFGPPEHLAQPVNAPIAEGLVSVIEKIAPAAGMKLFVERTLRGGATPHLPIHSFGRLLVSIGIFFASTAQREKADHANLPDCARSQELHG